MDSPFHDQVNSTLHIECEFTRDLLVSGCRQQSCTWASNWVHMPWPERASYLQVLWSTLCSGAPPLGVWWWLFWTTTICIIETPGYNYDMAMFMFVWRFVFSWTESCCIDKIFMYSIFSKIKVWHAAWFSSQVYIYMNIWS